jgi:hypothetical protein
MYIKDISPIFQGDQGKMQRFKTQNQEDSLINQTAPSKMKEVDMSLFQPENPE